MTENSAGLTSVVDKYSQNYCRLHKTLTFNQYLDIVRDAHGVCRTAFERMYDMIMSYGVEEIDHKKKTKSYPFFTNPRNGQDQIFGIHDSLTELVNLFHSAALKSGTEKRIILLHGPVGSSKSTIARLLKRGLERYSTTPEGALYSFRWKAPAFYGNDKLAAVASPGGSGWVNCPMHEDPLKLIPLEIRDQVFAEWGISGVTIEGDMCPACRRVFSDLMERYDGDFLRLVQEETQVYRLFLSEENRIGIGTFQPKDEKNQDSTELTGEVNYRSINFFGNAADPRAFDFNGEFNISNRGMIEFIEVLKLDVAFLYELLGASQEHRIKPKRFPQVALDTVIIGHTNGPEYERLRGNQFMEALHDRTVKVDVPYNTTLSHEIRIHKRDYNEQTIRGRHFAPHALEIPALWSVLTRLEDPKHHNLTLLQKLKLYDGKTLPGFTLDNVEQLRKAAKHEGMRGISPRYIQDKIANTLVYHDFSGSGCINPFMILEELKEGLEHHALITSEDELKRCLELIEVAKGEYTDIVKSEVQRAIASDEEGMARLAGNYIDNVKAYTQKERVKNKFTGQDQDPDEQLMRSIEERIEIPDSRKDDFRRELMNYIGARALDGKTFSYKDNERLQKALELKLFADQKDSIKLSSMVTKTVDAATQAKIDIVRDRLMKSFGYRSCCAQDVLEYMASVFARGDVKDEKKK